MARRTKSAGTKKKSTKRATKKKTSRKAGTTRKKTARKSNAKARDGERLTLGAWRVPKDLLDRLNAASYWNRVSAAQLVRESLESTISKLERKNGGAFPKPPRRR